VTRAMGRRREPSSASRIWASMEVNTSIDDRREPLTGQ
jgi:hypothetical protein